MRTYRAALSFLARGGASGGSLPPEDEGPDPGACALCGTLPGEPERRLCSRCRGDQRRLFWMEAFGGGFFFAGVAALMYLLGRWYVG